VTVGLSQTKNGLLSAPALSMERRQWLIVYGNEFSRARTGYSSSKINSDPATGAEILVDSIISQGVETIFGLPGLQLDYIFDALYDRQKEVRAIHTRHEQAAAYMAFGYAQASGRVGTCMVVPGPGVLNASRDKSNGYESSVLYAR
jgi:Thiamine pyrophosphate enzyme, N-terminal TPP binding domain